MQGAGHHQEATPQIRQGQAMGQGHGPSQGASQPLIGRRPRVERGAWAGLRGDPRPRPPPSPQGGEPPLAGSLRGGGPDTCARLALPGRAAPVARCVDSLYRVPAVCAAAATRHAGYIRAEATSPRAAAGRERSLVLQYR